MSAIIAGLIVTIDNRSSVLEIGNTILDEIAKLLSSKPAVNHSLNRNLIRESRILCLIGIRN
jgi:hypothetical protein